MSIITKRGDEGETDLLFQKKAQKTSPRIEALGALDELNAHLGLSRVYATEKALITWIDAVQRTLINLMGEVATLPEDYGKYTQKGYGVVTEQDVCALEKLAQDQEVSGNTFKGWARPGKDGSLLSAQLHVTRTICRRAERRCWNVPMASRLPRLYLNRLADVLWLIARV